MRSIEQKVLELVGEQAGLDPKEVSLNSKFEDLNLDSVAIVELVFTLEETFKISIPFEGLDESELKRNFNTVSSLINLLKSLLQKNAKGKCRNIISRRSSTRSTTPKKLFYMKKKHSGCFAFF